MRLPISVFWLKAIIHLAAFSPAAWFFYQATIDSLGSDPVKAIIHFTGISAFNVLLLTLLISPAAKFAKIGQLMQVRRLVGLYVFFYACLHVLSFLAFELAWQWQEFVAEVIKRPYITVGMAAWLFLLALSVTSPMAVRKRMGRNWQKLHNYIYLCAGLVGVHFYWSVKSEIIEPLIYLTLVLILLSFRWRKFRSR